MFFYSCVFYHFYSAFTIPIQAASIILYRFIYQGLQAFLLYMKNIISITGVPRLRACKTCSGAFIKLASLKQWFGLSLRFVNRL